MAGYPGDYRREWVSFVGARGAKFHNNQTANVKVIHASPDAPGVDLVVDGALAKTNLMFPENTGYLAIPISPGRDDVASIPLTLFDNPLRCGYIAYSPGSLTLLATRNIQLPEQRLAQ
jgi:hypothetical protein